jgi:[protein-PII] uridylyltransferase
MQVATSLHPAVVESRGRLIDARAKLRLQHDGGSPGQQVCARWTEIVDSVLADLFKVAVEELQVPLPESSYAVVALGGYGRRDLAPYSDLDLTMLHTPAQSEQVIPLARRLTQIVVDAGLQLGFSMRTPSQAMKLAWRDATIFTSLLESRLLFGSEELLSKFLSSFRLGTMRRCRRIIAMVEQERWAERQKFGETVYLLQPNVKRSRGGLRDIQLVRWIGFARYGEAEPEQLAQRGLLSAEDYHSLRRGYQYLLRIRNQLHFEAGKAQDSLDRGQQIRMATWAETVAEEGVLPVEQFMREYFEYTSEVRYSSAHFVESAKIHSWLVRSAARFLSIPLTPEYRLSPRTISANARGLQSFEKDPSKVLEFMALANRYNRRIEHSTWRAIRSAMQKRKPGPLGDEAAQRFMKMMEHPGRLGEVLRRLHELRVLEQIIPPMKHARSLLQFNDYHKYTVDAHCIRSVEMATDFNRDSSLLGSVYRSLKNKRLLHLALLMHDLGKGFPEDHSEVGAQLADETARLLQLSEADRELLVFLIRQHLLMTHTAFRFDISLTETIVRFAAQVGSVEALQMLFLLSCADLAAVGPGALNEWKLNLITQLYQRTDSQFRDEKPDEGFRKEVEGRRQAIRRLVSGSTDVDWWNAQVDATPISYLMRYPASQLHQELSKLKLLDEANPAIAWSQYHAEQNAVEYTVAIKQFQKRLGIFHRITGALSGQGMSILSAEIHTQPGEIAWDRFLVQDPDHEGQPPEGRRSDVCRAIVNALDPKNQTPPTFRRLWQAKASGAASQVRLQPNLVQFDNNTSEDYTIISVFAYDRRGLLYDISKVLYDQELDLQIAKISTHLDQVVDVFYVTDLESKKVVEPTRLYTLRQRLLKAIETE